MLTQKEKTDEFYEQYTIYSIKEKGNETSTNLYPMKIVEDVSLDNRFKSSD